jgi:metal-dependent amidase/aminoacylase/carboxypeptidase family protein
LHCARTWTRSQSKTRAASSSHPRPPAYQRVAPGCFFFVGAGEKGAFPHHHPRFTIDESALAVGIDTLTRTTLRFLGA